MNESKAVYRNLSAEQLEFEYSPSKSVTNATQLMAAWQQRSEKFRAGFKGRQWLDLAYGDQAGETLDIFTNSSSKSPALVYIHGGYWQRTDKSDYSYLAERLVEEGITVVIPNYTLCPATTVGGIVDEMRRAMAWLHRHIADYGGDPARLHVCGHSAGGHLTAMMALTDWHELGHDLPPNLVKSGMPISGVFELEPLIHTSINDPLAMDLSEAQALSPRLKTPGFDVPMAFAVGGDESNEFRRQSHDMCEYWQRSGLTACEAPCSGHHHFDVIDLMLEADSAMFKQIQDFVFS